VFSDVVSSVSVMFGSLAFVGLSVSRYAYKVKLTSEFLESVGQRDLRKSMGQYHTHPE